MITDQDFDRIVKEYSDKYAHLFQCPKCKRELSRPEARIAIKVGHCSSCGPGPEATDDPERNADEP